MVPQNQLGDRICEEHPLDLPECIDLEAGGGIDLRHSANVEDNIIGSAPPLAIELQFHLGAALQECTRFLLALLG